MRRSLLLATVVGTLIAVGCVPSLQPLATDDTRVFDEGLLGKWTDNSATWEFERHGTGYKLVLTDGNGKSGRFLASLVELDGRRYLDLVPDADDLKTLDYYKFHLIPAHGFVSLVTTDSGYRVAHLNPGWVDDFVENHPDEIATMRIAEGDRLIFTASTEELQKFFIAHCQDPEFFLDPSDLNRPSE